LDKVILYVIFLSIIVKADNLLEPYCTILNIRSQE